MLKQQCIKLCRGIYFKTHCGTDNCEQNSLCNTGTCFAIADSPGYRCNCPDGVSGAGCETSGFFIFLN